MWKTVAKYVALVALICYTVVAVSWANRQASAQACSGIDVQIEQAPGAQQQFVSVQGVLAELQPFSTNYAKHTVGSIDLNALEKKMQGNNNYEHVECALLPNGRLSIRIIPMIPEARVVCPDGNGYYLNRDGKRMDALPSFHTDVPVISGNFDDRFPAASVLPLVRIIKEDPRLTHLVSMIYAQDRNNIYLIPRIRGHVVCVGDTSNMRTKLDNLLLMYNKVMPYKGWETYDTISVKFKGQIVATRRDKTPLHVPESILEEEDPEDASLDGLIPQANAPATSTVPAD